MTISGIFTWITGWLGFLNVSIVLAPTCVFIIGSGLVFSNALVGASEKFAHMAGTAGAMHGFLQIAGSFSISLFVASLHEHNQCMLGFIYTFLGATAFTLLLFLKNNVEH